MEDNRRKGGKEEKGKEKEKERGTGESAEQKHHQNHEEGGVADLKNELTWFLQSWKKELHIDPDSQPTAGAVPVTAQPPSVEDKAEPETTSAQRVHKGDEQLVEAFSAFHINERMPLPFVLEAEPHLGGPLDLFPEEVLVHILTFLENASSLARVSCVCKKLFMLSREPILWRLQCFKLWGKSNCKKDAYIKFKGWYNMYMARPRLRYDGIFISKNTYVRQGTTEWTYNQPVHSVVYYRYLRFFNNGDKVIYSMSLEQPRKAIQWFHPNTLNVKAKDSNSSQSVFAGTFVWDSMTGDTEVWVNNQKTHSMQHFIARIGCRQAGNMLYMTVNDYLTSSYQGPEISHFPTTIPISSFRFYPLPPEKLDPPIEAI